MECRKVLSLEELVRELHIVFESDAIEVEAVEQLMQAYKSDPTDWAKFALLDPYKYTRNLVDAGNGKFDLMLLAWNTGQASSIHDHAGSHCFMKVMGGEVEQELYCPLADVKEGEKLDVLSRSQHDVDEVLYISDEVGLHRIANTSHVEPAFTLHLYCPPYKTCHAYDARTAKSLLLGNLTFFSKGGVKVAPTL